MKEGLHRPNSRTESDEKHVAANSTLKLWVSSDDNHPQHSIFSRSFFVHRQERRRVTEAFKLAILSLRFSRAYGNEDDGTIVRLRGHLEEYARL